MSGGKEEHKMLRHIILSLMAKLIPRNFFPQFPILILIPSILTKPEVRSLCDPYS